MAAPASQVRSALNAFADSGVARLAAVLPSLTGSPDAVRADLLDLAPSVIFTYTDGSSALAADWYDDLRDDVRPSKAYAAEPVVADRAEKIGRMVAWASQPLFDGGGTDQVALRLLPEVQKEIARPFRDTITTNTRRDPSAEGWRRVASGKGCKFCRFLSDRGSVYKQDTVHFAAHSNCHCSAEPVFQGLHVVEASPLQYVASKRYRTPEQRAANNAKIRAYLAKHYGD